MLIERQYPNNRQGFRPRNVGIESVGRGIRVRIGKIVSYGDIQSTYS